MAWRRTAALTARHAMLAHTARQQRTHTPHPLHTHTTCVAHACEYVAGDEPPPSSCLQGRQALWHCRLQGHCTPGLQARSTLPLPGCRAQGGEGGALSCPRCPTRWCWGRGVLGRVGQLGPGLTPWLCQALASSPPTHPPLSTCQKPSPHPAAQPCPPPFHVSGETAWGAGGGGGVGWGSRVLGWGLGGLPK